jgi:hypothetical protein
MGAPKAQAAEADLPFWVLQSLRIKRSLDQIRGAFFFFLKKTERPEVFASLLLPLLEAAGILYLF